MSVARAVYAGVPESSRRRDATLAIGARAGRGRVGDVAAGSEKGDQAMLDVIERYVVLSLRLGRHIDGFVDFYYGPPGLARLAEGEEPVAPGPLADEARELAGSLGGIADPQRRRWLTAQLDGLAAVAERLDGRPLSYEEEVRRCFGIEVVPVPEDELVAAHQ